MSTRCILAAAAAALAVASLDACHSSTGPQISDTQLWVIRLEQVQSDAGRLGTIYFFLRLNKSSQADTGYACDGGSGSKQITTFVATVHAPEMRLQPAADGSANGSWGGCYGLFLASVSITGGPTYHLSGPGEPPYEQTDIQIEGPDFCSGTTNGRRWSSGDRTGCWTMYKMIGADFSTALHPDAYIDIVIREQSGNDWWLVRRAPYIADSVHILAGTTVTWQDLRGDRSTDQFDAYYFPVIGQTHVYANCATDASTPARVGLLITGTDDHNANSFQCTDGWSRTGP